MNKSTAAAEASPAQAPMSRGMTVLLATACGLIAANIYYSQPLVGPIATELGLSPDAAGLIVTMTQIGYGVGLLLIVPLGDLLENRKLILSIMGLGVVALLGAAFSPSPGPFLLAALLIGIGSVSTQVILPFAAHLAPEAERGRALGNVVGGLVAGIMLARPVASFITAMSSWRVVFIVSASAMVLLAIALARLLPKRQPQTPPRYGELLASMGRLVLTMPLLRRRAFYQICLFAAFSLFWTTTPLLLAGPDFRLSQAGIALFALAGAAGAIAAPIAGWAADKGWSRPATGLAILAVALAFPMSHIGPTGSPLALGFLVAAAILLDFGLQMSGTIGLRAIFTLGAPYRSRLNGLYITSFFMAGAIGSAVGVWAFTYGGWLLTSSIGLALPLLALAYFATERK